ncbi:alpha/beta hydrolase [Pseudoclavibacter endophyticus]|nr:alpha/beta hydrolase [Pseudoclavibacter endophyticus]
MVGGTASDRPPLVLVHGGGVDNAGISWFSAFEAFGGERRVVGVDLPGFGGSLGVEPVGGPDRMADVVVRAARQLGLQRAVVAGVSMGGDVALNVALRHPDVAQALVLVAPGGLTGRAGPPGRQFVYGAAAALPDPLLGALARLMNRFTGPAMRAMMHDPDAFPREVADEFLREARAPGAGMGYGRYNQATLGRVGMRNNLLPFVHRISAPALFFHGAEDPLVSPDGSRRAAERMPNGRLVLVPETGHWAQLESPERFETEVRAFLEEVDAAAGAAAAIVDN